MVTGGRTSYQSDSLGTGCAGVNSTSSAPEPAPLQGTRPVEQRNHLLALQPPHRSSCLVDRSSPPSQLVKLHEMSPSARGLLPGHTIEYDNTIDTISNHLYIHACGTMIQFAAKYEAPQIERELHRSERPTCAQVPARLVTGKVTPRGL